ncbi:MULTISPECIES: copper resistance protein B [Psychrobacter]|uniref:copper resistance protein B n=2 Tax=Moraxellaceae TaxID=468 RepID=UPI000869A2B7|nr:MULTISPECIES: copper resistance protein B [Psychrobacter]OEH68808.1 MAG: copper resistance protein [Psychrobacter sp. B29-1]PKG61591.1 copper resistance protein B [Psychrobacter sp. Choline-3u-12]PKG65309.1 copper resistance protein B [Psychrobacter sp. Choline-02u-13]PKH54399.1 copper resistance protein B [Psychrobacter sp. Choline-02u-9]TEW88502.1 copper resistance protein B [Psychrobacter sp. 230]|tara:strand:- start:57860 stop:58984 length:1125 start_codon:yes stop_codon:yes gene_type:complete
MKISKKNLPFIGLSSLVLLASSFAAAAEMSNMDHSGMDMSGDMSDMDHSGMDMSGDMSGMDHSGMDMSGDMSGMDHSGMDMSDMDHSGMDMSGDMSSMDHSGMDMSGDMSDMEHSSMDMSGDMSDMEHSSMDMSGMQGGQPPADARSPDYSNGVPYGQYGKPMMMGSMPLWGVSVDDLGYQFDEDQINFEAMGWYGTDSNRIRLRTEGSAQTKDDKEIDSLSSLAYWKPLSIFWNGEAGVAYDTENDNAAIMAGIVGTAPYFIETDARAYLYTDGQLRLDLGAEYEWRLDQHWVVIPEVGLTAFSKDDHDNGITKGFNEMETEVRLTYETFSRQLAPYVGVSYETALGKARGQRRQENESVDSSSLTAGVKFWF